MELLFQVRKLKKFFFLIKKCLGPMIRSQKVTKLISFITKIAAKILPDSTLSNQIGKNKFFIIIIIKLLRPLFIKQ